MTVQDARNAYNSLSDAEKLQFEGELPPRPAFAGQPSQVVVDFVWRIIVGVFAGVFVLAALGVIFAVVTSFWVKPPGTINTDILITIFSTTVGFLAGRCLSLPPRLKLCYQCFFWKKSEVTTLRGKLSL